MRIPQNPQIISTPNVIFEHLPHMSECELKVVLVIVHACADGRAFAEISQTELRKRSGLSRQGVISGVEAAVRRGVIEICGHGKRGVNRYRMAPVSSTIQTGPHSGPVSIADQSTSESVHNVDRSTPPIDQNVDGLEPLVFSQPVQNVDLTSPLLSDDDHLDSVCPELIRQSAPPTAAELEVIRPYLVQLGLSRDVKRKLLAQGAERALALILHALARGTRNKAGLLRSMLERGDDPSGEYTWKAQQLLLPGFEDTPDVMEWVRPAPRPDVISAGLDERPGGGLLSVKDIWQAEIGQLSLQLNRSTYDTWLQGAEAVRYEDGVLLVRVRHAYAVEWLQKHLQHVVDRTATQIAGVPLRIQFYSIDQPLPVFNAVALVGEAVGVS